MPATIRQTVDAAEKYIGEVAGPGVQTYAEDRLFDATVRGFNLLFKKRRWEHYSNWFRFQLNGTTGKIVTGDMSTIKDFDDFIGVFRDGQDKPLPTIPGNANPYSQSVTSGTQTKYWTSLHVSDADFLTKKLQFYPVASTEFINIAAMVYPLDPIAESWDWEDVMYFDEDLLTYAASVEFLSADGLNVSATNTAQGKMESRYKDIIANFGNQPIPIRGRTGIPDRWFSPPV